MVESPNVRRWRVGREKVCYICDAVNCLSLELAVVELLNGGTEIGHRLIFDESAAWLVMFTNSDLRALTLGHRVHDQLQSRQRRGQRRGRSLSDPTTQ
jgi:hypothetical protein